MSLRVMVDGEPVEIPREVATSDRPEDVDDYLAGNWNPPEPEETPAEDGPDEPVIDFDDSDPEEG